MAAKAKKLYFDMAVLSGDSSIVKLTEETETTPGDRYGNLLAEVPAATILTPTAVRQRNEVTAIFQPRNQPAVAGVFNCIFVSSANANAPALGTAAAGATAVTLQNPCVKVSYVGGSGTVSGTLYIQRQHSIEA